jgi:NAD(P)-dependent dehydrogenase (short-subunit alcohol dehydrogenase family)
MNRETKGVAIITGAASGIGAATSEVLTARGWRISGVDLKPADTEIAIEADVTDPTALEAAVERTTQELGPPDLLITAAGVYEMSPIAEIDDESWGRMLDLHLGGAANACWAVLPGMLERGEGQVILLSSELALGGGSEDVHYVAAKGAIVGLTRSLGIELARTGIRVNGVAPGPTDTPLLVPDSPWRESGYLATLPLGRMVNAEEVAHTVVFLAEEGTYFQGQTISPNAGAVI